MYLSQVDLVGFKSFAHKTSIKFDDGITAIVGPNGCGKTNIVDAIRWVLGEQKSSVLRSERMDSVIFCGTANRRGLGFAEVSLVIENTKNILPIDYSQIMISRRLYRSGDSEYLLNKQVCRLKDISNLLMDSGMGADAYSVIELSMIEMLLKDSDDFRKRLFEEASGITKYKSRRQETLRKLGATRQDLIRVKDIINEVERNVNALKLKMNRAHRYEKLKNELMSVEKLFYFYKLDDLHKRKKPIESEIDALKNTHSNLSGKVAKDKAAFEKAQNEIIEKQKLLAQAQDKLNKFSEHVRATDSSIATLSERSAALGETQKRLELEIVSLKDNTEETISRIEDSRRQYVSIEHELEGAGKKLNEFRDKRNVFLEEYKLKKSIFLEKNQKAFDVLKNLEEKKRAKDTLMHESKECEKRLESLHESHKESTGKLKLLQKTDLDISSLKSQLENKIAKEKKNKEELRSISDKLIEDMRNYELQINELKVSLETNKAKYQFLNSLVEEYGGLPSGVSKILQVKDEVAGVLGTLADLISVPDQYRNAVEAILGEQAHYVVVDSVKNVENALSYLRSLNSGRATFVALDKINANLNAPIHKNENRKDESGILLVDEIKTDKSLIPLLNVLLGDVVYVEGDMLDAKIRRTYPCRFVNNSGEIVSTEYLYSGGRSKDSDTSIIGRKDRMTEIDRIIKNCLSELEKKVSALQLIREENEKIVSKLSEKDRMVENKSKELELLHRRFDIVIYEKNQLEEELEKLIFETKQLELFKTDTTQINEIGTEISRLESERESLEDERDKIQYEEAALETERENVENNFSDYNAQTARIKESLLSRTKESERLDLLLGDIHADKIKREESLQEARNLIVATNQKIDELKETLENLFNDQRQCEENVLANREELNTFQEETKSEFDSFMTIQNDVESVKDTIQGKKEDLLEIHNELSFLNERMEEKGIEIDSLKAGTEEYDLDEIIQKKQNLIQRTEVFGPVNLEALDEYDKEKERMQFLISQSEDLAEAEKTLIETIEKINNTAKERFEQTFQLVRINFKSIFTSFFGDGEADMQIVETDDPLHSKIDVFAQPSGKKIQSIALLSGGEKSLTALAILLAIYKVKPSPFCILDEVDAPLDDANVTRFTTMLKEFSKDTQFIVVTHNKKSMEVANNLYGVTMEETGISKLISVRINHEEVKNR